MSAITYIAGPFEPGLVNDCGGVDSDTQTPTQQGLSPVDTRSDSVPCGPANREPVQLRPAVTLSGRKPAGADAAVVSGPYPAGVNEAWFPSRAESVFHRDYAETERLELIELLTPVSRCDSCIAVLGGVFVVGIYTLIWCFEFIQRAQTALHGVTP